MQTITRRQIRTNLPPFQKTDLMLKLKYTFPIISFIFISCKTDQTDRHAISFHSPSYTLNDFKPVDIKSDSVKQESMSSIKSVYISEINNQIILTSARDSHFFHIYDLTTLQKKYSFFSFSPTAIPSLFRMRHFNSENAIHVLDGQNNRLLLFDLNQTNKAGYEPVSISLPYNYIDPVIINNNQTIADAIKRNKFDYLFQIALLPPPYNVNTAVHQNRLFLSNGPIKDTTAFNMTYQGIFHRSKSGNNWLFVYEKLPLLQLMDNNLLVTESIIGPDSIFFQDIRVTDKTSTYSYFEPYKNRPAYFSLQAKLNQKHIFIGLKDTYNEVSFNKIIQFDLLFKPLYLYHIDHKISSFDIDSISQKIYYVDEKKSNNLYYFNYNH